MSSCSFGYFRELEINKDMIKLFYGPIVGESDSDANMNNDNIIIIYYIN